jgi:aspartate-semialdehyde dehydrogenase
LSTGYQVAVLGASGAVGREFVRLFERRSFPVSGLKLLASARSAGTTVPWRSTSIEIEEVAPGSFSGIDFAFFSAGASRSREWAPIARQAGATVIDNSSAFRMDPDVPLVVPEVNGSVLSKRDTLVSVPNCSAIILLMAVAPLRALGEIDRLIVSTYQSASGGGAAMIEDLLDQTRDYLEGRVPTPKATPHPYAFNLFSHNTPVGPDGHNEEESKVITESRKILGQPDLKVNVTCVRVPVLRAHTESVTIEFKDKAPSVEAVREAIGSFPGVRLVDEPLDNRFPMPSEASGQDDVLVGRIRKDASHDRAVCLLVSGDQLLKGAALTGVQIAEKLCELRKVAETAARA